MGVAFTSLYSQQAVKELALQYKKEQSIKKMYNKIINGESIYFQHKITSTTAKFVLEESTSIESTSPVVPNRKRKIT